MARRRYYRRAVRVVAAKKKWATNIKSGVIQINTTGGQGSGHDTIVQNSTQSATPTPVIVKCGNFKVQGDCYITGNVAIGNACTVVVYILYVPQVISNGGDVTSIVYDHPEWIMGWKLIDVTPAANTSSSASFSFSSRLKRNLNSGDGVAVAVVANDPTSATLHTVYVNYHAQWWTCSN